MVSRFNHAEIIHRRPPVLKLLLPLILIIGTCLGAGFVFSKKSLHFADRQFYRDDLRHDNYTFYEHDCTIRVSIRDFDGRRPVSAGLTADIAHVNVIIDADTYNDKTMPDHFSAQTVRDIGLEIIETRYIPLISPKQNSCPRPDVRSFIATTRKESNALRSKLDQRDSITTIIKVRKETNDENAMFVLTQKFFRKGFIAPYNQGMIRSYKDKLTLPINTPEENAKTQIRYFLNSSPLAGYWTGGWD